MKCFPGRMFEPMQIEATALPGVLILTPTRHCDDRGFFSESWNRSWLKRHGIDIDFVQENHSFSHAKGTLRGLHFQAPPYAQAKLVRCVSGRLFDVAVDVRKGAPTYGQWVGVELSSKNGRQLLVPVGFLHGFVTLSEETEILYKCSDHYAPGASGAVRWDSCGIHWPLDVTPVLSPKDAAAVPFSTFDSPFIWGVS